MLTGKPKACHSALSVHPKPPGFSIKHIDVPRPIAERRKLFDDDI